MPRCKKKTRKPYVLYGCLASAAERYDCQGYVGLLQTGSIGLVSIIEQAFKYTDDKDPGHGTPEDWVKLFREDYCLNVHPVFLNG